MKRKKWMKGLAFFLALSLEITGITVPAASVQAAETEGTATARDALEGELLLEEEMQEETEEYTEEATDFSWLEEIEQEEVQVSQWVSEMSDPQELFSSGTVNTPVEEDAEENTQPVLEGDVTFGDSTDADDGATITPEMDNEQNTQPDAGAQPGTEDSADTQPETDGIQEDSVQPEQNPQKEPNGTQEDPTFGSGPEDTWEEDLSAVSQVTLSIESGEDLYIPLNRLLYRVKDYATDEKQYTVVIPPGNYNLTGTICLYSNIRLYAAGATITKTSTNKHILLRLGCSENSAGGYEGYRNIAIEGGTWDLNYQICENKDEPGGYVGFRICHATNVALKNIRFYNNLKSHFVELGGVKNASVTGCYFSGYYAPYEAGGQECVQLDICEENTMPRYAPYDGTTCDNILIKNNVFENVFAGVGSHSMTFNKPYTNITITENSFYNVKKRAVWCLNYKNSSVTNNVMKNVGMGVCVGSMHAGNTHLEDGKTPSASQNQQAQNVIVSGNKITLGKSSYINGAYWRVYGIRVYGQAITSSKYAAPKGNYIIKGVTVKNNTISGAGYGINLNLASGCSVYGNTLKMNRTSAYTNFGIHVGSSQKNSIKNNYVTNSRGHGIYVYKSVSKIKSTSNQIVGNTVKSVWADGIYADADSNNTTISKNQCVSNRKRGIVVSKSTGIVLTSNKATSNKNLGIYGYKATIKTLTGNQLQGNGTAYAMRFVKCKGKYQTLKNLTVNKVKRTYTSVTGYGTGGKTVTIKRKNTKLASAKLYSSGYFYARIKKQKKGTVLTITVTDKYKNSVIGTKKVV